MKITLFTGNQPRHLSLAEELAQVSDELFVVQECTTLFPGKIDDFYQKSDVMQEYFNHVITSEKSIFGIPRFLPNNVKQIVLKDGDLNHLSMKSLQPALNSDLYIVFGASYIKGELIDHLIINKAINIHMGVSPYYRGSSCNFWALFDGRPELVGATIHLLSKGLDSGDILFHALPSTCGSNPFDLGMLAVKSAHTELSKSIRNKTLFSTKPLKQDKALEIRYTKNKDFTNAVAKEYLSNLPKINIIEEAVRSRETQGLILI